MKYLPTMLAMFLLPATAIGAGDPHSYAETDKFIVRHVAIDLRADFEAHRLEGTAELTVEQVDPNADTLTLDTRDLEIGAIHLVEMSGQAKVLAFKVAEPDPILGSKLSIEFPHCCAATSQMRIRIAYRTSNEASALQWLAPSQTYDAKPYLYSQGQAIHTRSWIPLQDTPSVRVTYEARIRTPPDLVAVMSAARVGDGGGPAGEYRFEMKQRIPSYLIALAVGDLKFQAVGDRTGVWTEPSRLAAAAYEFADLPRMLEAGERMAGPYRWDRYDLLVMPRAFAYGGMENPRLSFISPSTVAGDRSLVSVIVHELAHSWSGNLVTNSTWDDFWLNEGFTSYLERRLVEALYGERRARMEDAIAYEELVQTIKDLEADGHPADSALHLDLAGRDPNEGTSDVAYQKGALVPGLPRGTLRQARLRCVPARVLRCARVPEHRHGDLPHLAARLPEASRCAGDLRSRDRCSGSTARACPRRCRRWRRMSLRRWIALPPTGARGASRPTHSPRRTGSRRSGCASWTSSRPNSKMRSSPNCARRTSSVPTATPKSP